MSEDWEEDARARAEERIDGQLAARAYFGAAHVRCFAKIDPAFSEESRKALEAIHVALMRDGIWSETEEWRISTYFVSTIQPEPAEGKTVYRTTVECDGQKLSCCCPTIERAYAFSRAYQQLIIEQIYAVGAPWMDRLAFNFQLTAKQDI